MSQSTIKTAFALIFNENTKVLLIQEGYEPGYGKWCLPGGHVESNEDLQTAITREVREETGGLIVGSANLTVTKILNNIEYLGRPERNDEIIELNIFKCSGLNGKIDKTKLTEELDVKWFKMSDLEFLSFRWPWLKEFILENYERLT